MKPAPFCAQCGKQLDQHDPNYRKKKFCNIACMAASYRGTEADFWAKVDRRGPDECWPWKAATFKKKGKQMGYGRHAGSGPYTYAHRCAWIFAHGEISAGQIVMHACDNVLCCNPRHLSLGTDLDNARDCIAKGRKPTKLTPDQVREIRALLPTMKQSEIAEKYGITDSQLSTIKLRKQWKHV